MPGKESTKQLGDIVPRAHTGLKTVHIPKSQSGIPQNS